MKYCWKKLKTGKKQGIKTMADRLILRKEYFGGVLFDSQKLSYRFVDSNEAEKLSNETNIRLLESNSIGLQKGVLSSPIRVYWEITRKCDKKCPQCFTSSGKPSSKELLMDECFKLIDGLKNDKIIEIRITGGEPTIRNGWESLIKYANSAGIIVSLNTHGSYNDEKRKAISLLDIAQIIISLDGPKHIHDQSRGKGSFDLVLGTIKYFSGKNIPVRVNTLLTKDVIPYIDEVTRIVKDYASELCFMELKPIGRGGRLLNSLPDFVQMQKADKMIRALKEKSQKLRISTSYGIVNEGRVLPAPDLDLTACAAGFRGCNIDSEGNVYACGFQEELGDDFSLGNLRKNNFSLKDIWLNSIKLKSFRTQNIEQTRICHSCEYFQKQCFGNCIVLEDYCKKNNNCFNLFCYRRTYEK
jgi:MoaA/NifB/PqqE/SkfB family radical SAM enzyme